MCMDQHDNERANGVCSLLIELRDVSFGGQIYFKYFSMWNPFKPSESSLALPFPEFILFLHFTITEKPLKTDSSVLVTVEENRSDLRGQRLNCL